MHRDRDAFGGRRWCAVTGAPGAGTAGDTGAGTDAEGRVPPDADAELTRVPPVTLTADGFALRLSARHAKGDHVAALQLARSSRCDALAVDVHVSTLDARTGRSIHGARVAPRGSRELQSGDVITFGMGGPTVEVQIRQRSGSPGGTRVSSASASGGTRPSASVPAPVSPPCPRRERR